MTGHERITRELDAALGRVRAELLQKCELLTPGEAGRLATLVRLLTGRRLAPVVDQMRRAELVELLAGASARIDGREVDADLLAQAHQLAQQLWPLVRPAGVVEPVPRSRRLPRATHLRSVP